MGKQNLQTSKKLLLWLLSAGGLVVLSILAPKLPYRLIKSYLRQRSRLKERLNYFEKKGWIKIEEKGDNFIVKLVEAGKLKAYQYQLDDLKITKPANWDGKWRIVIFDIPDKKKLARDVLRRKLKELGFFRLQKSVFVYPYPCRKEIEVIKSAYEIWPYINLIEANKIDQEDELKGKFDLL